MTAVQRANGLKVAAGWLYVLALLEGVGCVIVGVILAMHKIPVTDCGFPICIGTRHPWVGAGIGVAVGGVVNALVVGAVGYLYQAVGQMRAGRSVVR